MSALVEDAQLTDADRTGKDAARDRREKREHLLAAMMKVFPVDTKPPYGTGTARYQAAFQDRDVDVLQGLLTGRMATAMRRWYEILEKAVKRHGLSLKHWQALFMLAVNDPGETLTSIAARVGVPSATLVRILDDLEAAGLIAREIDERDRRSKLLDLTPLGEQTFFTLFEINCNLRRQFLQGVSEGEILLMVEAADVMNDNLDRMAAPDQAE